MILQHEQIMALLSILVFYEDLVLLPLVVEIVSFNELNNVMLEHEIYLHALHDIDRAVVIVQCLVKM